MNFSKLKIGYFPYSLDLSHPGDRRRLVFWANSRRHQIQINQNKDVDVIVLTANSNFKKQIEAADGNIPVVIDLVDMYLAQSHFTSDLLKGSYKVLSGQQSGIATRFSTIVKTALKSCTSVICETAEQAELISPLNNCVFPILDFHEEIELNTSPIFKPHTSNGILWEGQPYTLASIHKFKSALRSAIEDQDIELKLVTDSLYNMQLPRYFARSTRILAKRTLDEIPFKLVDWSLENLKLQASSSILGLVPVSNSRMSKYKAENRLLIYWRLGLPALVSPNLAHERLQSNTGIPLVCYDDEDAKSKLLKLLNYPTERAKQVRIGQDYIRQYHSKDKVLSDWDSAILFAIDSKL